MNSHDDTVVCVLTPAGRGAVAVVAVAGWGAEAAIERWFQPANCTSLSQQPVGRIVYGQWDGASGEDLVICRRSVDRLEVHCHGGRHSSRRIVADLIEVGCTEISREQWTATRRECPIRAAAQLALVRSATIRTAEILLAQYNGALRAAIVTITDQLELGDYTAAASQLDRLLQRAEFGLHLTTPWQVVIAGEPNVGKSSLINALVGYERAIVYDLPGTTRDVVSSTTAIDGWPVEFSDTAGLHEETDAIEGAGIALARERLASADFVVWVVDAQAVARSNQADVWQYAAKQAEAVGVPLDQQRTQLVVNKLDIAPIEATADATWIGTCAIDGTGIDRLLSALICHLVPNVLTADAAVPFTTEQQRILQAALAAVNKQGLKDARELLRSMLDRDSQLPK